MRYILCVVVLLKACDVTDNGRHLGFYQELENRWGGKSPSVSLMYCKENTVNFLLTDFSIRRTPL